MNSPHLRPRIVIPVLRRPKCEWLGFTKLELKTTPNPKSRGVKADELYEALKLHQSETRKPNHQPQHPGVGSPELNRTRDKDELL